MTVNLAAQPEAAIQLDDGRRIGVRAESLEGADLAAAWQRIEREAPDRMQVIPTGVVLQAYAKP